MKFACLLAIFSSEKKQADFDCFVSGFERHDLFVFQKSYKEFSL